MKGKVLLLILLLIVASILLLSSYGKSGAIVVYDCGMAEWHPDVPADVKDECRRIKKEQWERNLQNESKRPISI